MQINGSAVLIELYGARVGAPKGKRNSNFRHGGRTKDAADASRYINELARLVPGTD
jgi:hypothetical protein